MPAVAMPAQVDRLAPFPQVHFLYVKRGKISVRLPSDFAPCERVPLAHAPRKFHAVGVGGEALFVRRRAYFYHILIGIHHLRPAIFLTLRFFISLSPLFHTFQASVSALSRKSDMPLPCASLSRPRPPAMFLSRAGNSNRKSPRCNIQDSRILA